MGTRYEDQPVEQWAGPGSLDPTPVWKQYILVALLLFVGLVVVVVFSAMALAPNFVTPPALVPGDRLVLAVSDLPAVGATPKLISLPVIDDGRSFWLTQPRKGEIYAIRRTWLPVPNGTERCVIDTMGGPSSIEQRTLIGHCGGAHAPTFSATGHSFEGGVRDLDQYLVSVSGDRVVVNLSRVIESSERTSGPVPTGIPQPQTQQP
jgi:hypothetical protein